LWQNSPTIGALPFDLAQLGPENTMNTPFLANATPLQDPSEAPSWQQQLANVIDSPQVLLEILELPSQLLAAAQQGHHDFKLRVPRAFVNRIEKGNIRDPLLRQIWPFAQEQEPAPKDFVFDPLGEANSNQNAGIVHKYQNRVLLIVNGSCAVHCRYCFRRHFPYGDNQLTRQQWVETLKYVEQRPEINEVILSGGDPLSSSDARLFDLINAIEAIDHVKRLRIHSRLPIVIPERITHELVTRLQQSRLQTIMVVHANHANEIDASVGNALLKLHQAGITVLNQSVLLKGINDNAQSLIDLSERLFEFKTLPYYLHLLDKVVGAHHYDVTEQTAIELINEIQITLPGFLVPKLVREIDGQPSKTLISI